MDSIEVIKRRLKQSADIKISIVEDLEMINMVKKVSDEILETLKQNGKILICGNGGSASDALHMAGEMVGRFQTDRNGWPAIALNADVASITAIANDYGYDKIFERATEAYMDKNDLLVGISTSGNSETVYRAILKAIEIGGKTVALLGKDGGKIGKSADYPIIIKSDITARIQESHITVIHILCELVEQGYLNWRG